MSSVSQWGRVLVDEIEGAVVPAGELWVWPLGGPSLAVRSAGATAYIDPYTGSPDSGEWLRMVAVPYDAEDLRQADAVLSTHDHDDHCHEATLAPIVRNTDARLIGPSSSAKKMRGFGDPMQYSVFRCELSPTEKQAMKEALWDILNWGQDRVMLVDLGPSGARGDECVEFWGEPRVDIPARTAVIV